MTTADWEGFWPGKKVGGKTHIFTNMMDSTAPDSYIQWYEADVPVEIRGRAAPICLFQPTQVVGLRIRPVGSFGLVDCVKCLGKLRRHVLERLES